MIFIHIIWVIPYSMSVYTNIYNIEVLDDFYDWYGIT